MATGLCSIGVHVRIVSFPVGGPCPREASQEESYTLMAVCTYVRPYGRQRLRGSSLHWFGFPQLRRTAGLAKALVICGRGGLPAVMSAAVSESSGHVPSRGKFEDPTLRSTFAWTSQCPVSLAAGLSFLRV